MTEAPTVVAVRGELPAHVYPQAELTELFARLCLPADDRRLRRLSARLHENAGVQTRHLALPIERYAELDGFTAANDAFLDAAVELGATAITRALADVGLAPDDVDVIVSTTVTGIAVPSLEARIAARIGLRPDIRRVPMFGLGCLAGAAGIARLGDLLRPADVGVLVSVEFCSLTVQRDDPSAANMVASGLFGDGAAAVVAVGPAHELAGRGSRIVDTASHLYPDTARAMGWDVGSSGLTIVLGAEVPELVEKYLADDVDGLLAAHGMRLGDVDRWICHPGGPKVIRAIESVLGLTDDDLALTWRSLARVGNLSSASVLHVFADTLAERPPAAGDVGVLMAMGPGFAAELVLLRW